MNTSEYCARLSLAALLASAVSLQARAAAIQLPPDQTVGIASYVSGGIGERQADRFKAASDHYPLTIELLEHVGAHDEYTADARVRIVNHEGKTVFDERAEGPFLLVRLPAGDYKVIASLKGHELPARRVHLKSDGHLRTAFIWSPNVG